MGRLRDPKNNHIVFGLSDMASSTGENLWSSILGPYLDHIGFGAVSIGFMTTMLLFSQGFSSLILGGLSDRIGRKRPIIFSFISISIASLILGYTSNFILFTVLIFIVGFMNGIKTPSILASIAESVPVKSRGTAFGIFQLFRFTPMLLGSLFGGAIASFFGYQTLFSVHSILAMSATLIVLFIGVEVRKIAEKGKNAFMTAGRIALFSVPNTYKFLKENRSYSFLMIAFFVHGFGYYLGTSFWALYAANGIGLAIVSVGLVMSAHAFGLWVGAYPAGKLTDKIGGWIMISTHIILTTPALILYTLSPSLSLALLTSFFHGLVGTLDGPARPVIYSKMVGEEKMGIALGITESFMLLGRMIGPIVAGIVWSFIGISAPFWLGGLINLIALIPLGFSLKVERFNKTHPL